MSLILDRATTPTISGLVSIPGGGDLTGWVLTLVDVIHGAVLKTSEDASEILVLDPVLRTFEIYFTVADTEVAKNISVELRAVYGSRHYLLARDVLQINS